MKLFKINLLILAFLLLIIDAYSQGSIKFGLSAGGVISLGEVRRAHPNGIKFGFSEVFLIKPPYISIVAGQEYSKLSLTNERNYHLIRTSFDKEDLEYLSLYLGPRVGNEYGPFLMSSMIMSSATTDMWIGVDVGVGYSFRLYGFIHTLDMTTKMRWLNTIKHNKNEKMLQVIDLNITLYF